jgi:hypothetical protein
VIEPTEADIGRRVVYDPRPALSYTSKGTLVGLTGGPLRCWTQVQFDESGTGPLNVGNEMLRWADA